MIEFKVFLSSRHGFGRRAPSRSPRLRVSLGGSATLKLLANAALGLQPSPEYEPPPGGWPGGGGMLLAVAALRCAGVAELGGGVAATEAYVHEMYDIQDVGDTVTGYIGGDVRTEWVGVGDILVAPERHIDRMHNIEDVGDTITLWVGVTGALATGLHYDEIR